MPTDIQADNTATEQKREHGDVQGHGRASGNTRSRYSNDRFIRCQLESIRCFGIGGHFQVLNDFRARLDAVGCKHLFETLQALQVLHWLDLSSEIAFSLAAFDQSDLPKFRESLTYGDAAHLMAVHECMFTRQAVTGSDFSGKNLCAQAVGDNPVFCPP